MAAALLALGLGAYVAAALSQSSETIDAGQRATQAESSLVEVADPLARLCEQDPSVRARVGPACATAAEARTAGAVRAADGRNGTPGVPGTPGIPGIPGVNGTDGRDGIDATGIPGVPGRDGVDGVSPPCLSEPGQCRGADGRDGVNGRDGMDGQDAALPSSVTRNYPDGRSETCTRSGGDDTAPVFTCTDDPAG